jgi:hypothetical protein
MALQQDKISASKGNATPQEVKSPSLSTAKVFSYSPKRKLIDALF